MKVPLDTLVNLVQGFISYNIDDAAKFIKERPDLQEAADQVEANRAQRKDNEIDPKIIAREVRFMLAKNPNARDAYDRIVRTAKEICENDVRQVFKLDLYQCYIAACMYANQSPGVLAVCGTGQGKTFLMLLLAKIMREDKPDEDVEIFTASEYLAQQAIQEIGVYLEDDHIHIGVWREINAQNQSAIIIDEADVCFVDEAANFDVQKNLKGIFNITPGMRTFCLTATVTPNLEGILKQRPDTFKPFGRLEFKSQIELCKPTASGLSINFFSYHDRQECIEGFMADVSKQMLLQPVIVFIDTDKQQIYEMLTEVC